MSWWLILIIVLFLTLFITLSGIIILIKKIKKNKILTITNDINKIYDNLKTKKINIKELPVSVENIKDDIYFSDKVILGKYQSFKKISAHNISLKTKYTMTKKANKAIFLRYKMRDVNFIKSSNFIPLNQIDLLVSQKHVYFIDAFDLKTISLTNINTITFFWEKNNHIKSKQKYMGVEITYQDQHLFFLFNKYKSAISFVAHILVLGN